MRAVTATPLPTHWDRSSFFAAYVVEPSFTSAACVIVLFPID